MKNVTTLFQEEYDRGNITKELISKWLSGEGEEICFDQEPARRYCIGILTPLSDDETTFEDEKKKWILKRRPNSIGFEARITSSADLLKLTSSIKLSVYYRSVPTHGEQWSSLNIKGKDENIANDNTKVHFRQKYRRVDIVV